MSNLDELFKINCSTLFLLNPLGLSRKQLKPMGLVNCFLQDPQHPYEDFIPLYLLFHPRDEAAFKYFVDKEKVRTPLFIDEYDYEGGYVVLVYEFPEVFRVDYEHFIKGKYSALSVEYRKSLPKQIVVSGQPAECFQMMVIHKRRVWKTHMEEKLAVTFADEDEVWSRPNMEKETLLIENLPLYEQSTGV